MPLDPPEPQPAEPNEDYAYEMQRQRKLDKEHQNATHPD